MTAAMNTTSKGDFSLTDNVSVLIEEKEWGNFTASDFNFWGKFRKISDDTIWSVIVLMNRENYMRGIIESPLDDAMQRIERIYLENKNIS